MTFSKISLFATTILIVALLPSGNTLAGKVLRSMQQMNRAVSQATESQQEMEHWLEKKNALLQDSLEDQLRLERLRYQQKKYMTQIQNERATLAELDQERQEMEKMLLELEPELAARVDELESLIESDLPFLALERRERISMLRDSLMDHRLGLDEKLQRILEAYLIEAGYGRDVETITSTLDLDGVPTTVRVFRLGRVGLYFLSVDNSRAGRWNRKQKVWESLPISMIRTLNTAIDIADRKQAAELVELPVGRP